MTFWQAFRTATRETGIAILNVLPFGAVMLICAWLASTGRYITLAAVATISFIGWLVIDARLYQRRVERQDREGRAIGFGKHESPR